ncbi:aldolase/citrate lyase family protein [Halorubellus sp. PRR65]|uniref:HpcH/HpaI aldolase family protein n=1 Tax=Halorubellus sp. PRR65 TaxID=3098148 RepID=UPI002B25F632|nr:aldolase/citrate lyase family protein [Halorubellus sp. PRR65]
MQPDFAHRLRDRDALVGAWCTVGHPVVAEVLAAEPVDFVVLDGEHSENTIGDLADCVRAVDAANHRVSRRDAAADADADATGTATVVRASGPDRAEIKRLLDLGPDGILVPQIEDVSDAREAVRASQYPPEGVRGVAGGRAADYGRTLDDTVASANDDVATILQMETTGAIADADAIAALDGLDALFVGPADLSARLGEFGAFDTEAFRAGIDTVADAAATAPGSVAVGTLATSHENAPERRDDWEMDFVVAGVDVAYLRDGLDGYLDALTGADGSTDGGET